MMNPIALHPTPIRARPDITIARRVAMATHSNGEHRENDTVKVAVWYDYI